MLEDILEESWSYQEMVQKGLMKGIEQGLEQGLKQGLKQGLEQGRREERQREVQKLRQMLTRSVGRLFSDLVPLAQQSANALDDPDKLQEITMQMFDAENAEEARKHLLAAIDNKNRQ